METDNLKLNIFNVGVSILVGEKKKTSAARKPYQSDLNDWVTDIPHLLISFCKTLTTEGKGGLVMFSL